MISNYLKVILRNFLRYRLFTLINVLGLAAGLAASLLIGLFVRHEISYDQYYANAERIYRVSRDIQPPGEDTVRVSANSGPAAALLLQDFPQIEQVARLNTATNLLLSRDETAFYQNQLRFVDAAFFGLFEFEWLQGNPATALTEPASVVLTASLAAQYFGDINPVGMTLTLDNRLPLQVTGVIADLPQNTHLRASGFASIEALNTLYRPGYLDNWFSINTHTYILLEPGVGIAEIESGLAAFNERYVPQGGFSSAMRITALKDIHWARDMSGPLKPAGNFATIVIFSATGICILIIACINFINLSTAKFSQRALEVGVRKSIGASRSQLIRQFLGESLCLTVLAMLIALVLAELMVPMVSSFIGQELAFNYLATPLIFTSLIGATLLIGIIAGAYPAFSLSAFAPAKALKGKYMRGESGVLLRNALVVLQFTVSIILLISAMTIFSQMRHVSDLDLGFRKDQVVVLSLPEDSFAQWEPFREKLLAYPEITHISSSDSIPLRIGELGGARKEGDANLTILSEIAVDLAYFDTYDIALLAGRLFSANLASDGGAETGEGGRLILNEQAAREFGWTPDEAVGKFLYHSEVLKPVIGVVNNTIESARFINNPVLYQLPDEMLAGEEVSIRVTGNRLAETLNYIDGVWREFSPGQPVIRQFLDAMVEALYEEDRRHLELTFCFAVLAIGIACLGLFGLAVYNAQRRTREIGMRKVMGGSAWSIVLLLTNDFSKLVLLSNLIAWPVAYFAMERWLQNFVYRIDLTPLIFIGSGLIALCIAWVTVGGTAAKAASAKPVLALRYE